MRSSRNRFTLLALAAALCSLPGCVVESDGSSGGEQPTTTGSAAGGAAPATVGGSAMPGGDSLSVAAGADTSRPRSDLRLEVNVDSREVVVYRGGQRMGTYPVAVGSSEWPTERGEWTISQVVWNPEWIPPDQSWAEDSERKAPGAVDNPLGRAQLIYDAPRTIHGTNQPESIGKAVSHGSIRMRNEHIVELARQVQEAGGAGESDAWYRSAQENRTEKRIVDLPQPIPIRVQ